MREQLLMCQCAPTDIHVNLLLSILEILKEISSVSLSVYTLTKTLSYTSLTQKLQHITQCSFKKNMHMLKT